MDVAAWSDVQGLLEEWNENPPVELFARAYFDYKPSAGPADKFFGEDDGAAPIAAEGLPSISQAPPHIQRILEDFKKRKGNLSDA